MGSSEFLNENLAVQCDDLAGEINKVYQHLPWAAKNEAVSRLTRQIHQLAEEAKKTQESQTLGDSQARLREALSLINECVPLLDLCLRKILVSPDLHARWIKKLSDLEKSFNRWLNGISPGN